jgi:predicted DNA-binding WGR domain protein
VIQFEYVDAETKSFKQFSLTTQPTLFSNYGLVKYWGRIGQMSRFGIEEFDSPRELDARLLKIAKRRLSHGYRIVEVQGPATQYEVLSCLS